MITWLYCFWVFSETKHHGGESMVERHGRAELLTTCQQEANRETGRGQGQGMSF
jgi:hypothetical protein